MAPPSGRAGGANRALKIIHLFANHKFTGPADLAMVLAAGQQAEGAEVIFISENICQNRKITTVFHDQAHSNACHGRLQWNTCIHH